MEVRLTGLLFPGSSFLPFLKIGVTLAFLQSTGTLPFLLDLFPATLALVVTVNDTVQVKQRANTDEIASVSELDCMCLAT